uniref:Putative ribbon-helix-helix protein repressor n=1 Tax=viral metagenome TaxID=1070528 RepID=A0A6H2A1M1_9ZZZZ
MPKTKRKVEGVSITVPIGVIKKVRELAQEERRSVSQIISLALEEQYGTYSDDGVDEVIRGEQG